MTVAKTIELANAHAKNGNVEGACRILTSAMRAAKSGRAMFHLAVAKQRIIDPSFDKLIAQKQARA